MAKHKKKKKGHRKNPKRVAAGKKAFRNNPRPFGRRKKGHGKRKSKAYGPKKKKGGRGKAYHPKKAMYKPRSQYKVSAADYERIKLKQILAGKSPAEAEAYAQRVFAVLARKQAKARAAGVHEHHMAQEREATKKHWAAFGDIFAKAGRQEAKRQAEWAKA